MPVQSGFQATVSLLLGKGFLHPVVAIVNAAVPSCHTWEA